MGNTTIPLDVLAIAKQFAGLGDDKDLSAVEITMAPIHREQPRLADALHLWRVDLPGCDEIAARRDYEWVRGVSPMYTHALMSVFVVQLANGTFEDAGGRYDVEPAHP
jgi:hypothetical protein